MNFRTFVQCRNELFGMRIERTDVATFLILHVDFKTIGHTITHNHRWRKDEYLRILDISSPRHHLTHNGILAVLITFAFIPIFETHDERTTRTALSATHHIITSDGGIQVYLRNSTDTLLNLLHDAFGFRKRTTWCCGNRNKQRSRILIRNQSGFGGLDQYSQQDTIHSECYTYQPFAAEEELHTHFILVDQTAESCIKSYVETRRETYLFTFFCLHVGCHDESTECRTGSQGVQCRYTHSYSHRQTELRIKGTRSSTHKTNRNKHSHEDQ